MLPAAPCCRLPRQTCSLLPLAEPSLGPCCSSAATQGPRSEASRAPPESLAAAALAGVPPALHSPSSSSSSSSSASSALGYSEDDELSSSSGLDSDPEHDSVLGNGLSSAEVAHPGLALRPPAAAVKTTYKLRVGVLQGTTFLNQVRAALWQRRLQCW